jgi:hypothetical protein
MSQQKAFVEDAGYMERHRQWMVADDHLWLHGET